jgi:hypothetical protein
MDEISSGEKDFCSPLNVTKMCGFLSSLPRTEKGKCLMSLISAVFGFRFCFPPLVVFFPHKEGGVLDAKDQR